MPRQPNPDNTLALTLLIRALKGMFDQANRANRYQIVMILADNHTGNVGTLIDVNDQSTLDEMIRKVEEADWSSLFEAKKDMHAFRFFYDNTPPPSHRKRH